MKKSKPPGYHQLRTVINNIMAKLTKLNLSGHKDGISLYNDFLIISVVADSIPQDSIIRLYRELTSFQKKLSECLEHEPSTNWEAKLDLQSIMSILS